MVSLSRFGRPLAAAVLLASIAFGVWRLAGGTAGSPVDLFPSAGSPSASGSPGIVISEFGIEADTLWVAPAGDPSSRKVVAEVPHAANYGIYATVSPDGRYIAYTALSPGLRDPNNGSPADVWVMGADGSYPRLLASGADLLIAPIWAPDSAALVFRRSQSQENAAGAFQLVRISLDSGATAPSGESTLVTAEAGLFPVGFSPDGERLYYTQVSAAGTELGQVPTAGGPPSLLSHLGDDFTRDWHLSPDGSQIAFLAPEPSAAGTVLRAMLVGVDGKSPVQPALPAAAQPTQEFNPVWHPKDGDLTLGRLTLGEATAPAVRVYASGVQALKAPSQGFDVPLAWSPDGKTLAMRSFEGMGAEAGPWHLVLLDAQGRRLEVEAKSEISFVGWEAGGK